MVDLSNNSLTIGSGITINAGAQYADLVSEGSQINVEGAVADNPPTSTLYTYGVNHNTRAMFQDLANYSVKLTQSGDSLRQVLDDWAQYGALAANVASIRSRLAVTYSII